MVTGVPAFSVLSVPLFEVGVLLYQFIPLDIVDYYRIPTESFQIWPLFSLANHPIL